MFPLKRSGQLRWPRGSYLWLTLPSTSWWALLECHEGIEIFKLRNVLIENSPFGVLDSIHYRKLLGNLAEWLRDVCQQLSPHPCVSWLCRGRPVGAGAKGIWVLAAQKQPSPVLQASIWPPSVSPGFLTSKRVRILQPCRFLGRLKII